jgi:hypothetical protein
MKKFLSLMALLAFALILGARGLDPPRDHTPPGHEIVISDADQITAVADVITFQDVTVVTDEGPWQPPGVLYESGITTETFYPYTLTGEMQQNSSIILHIKDQLSDLQNNNNYIPKRGEPVLIYREAPFWNYTLFRCDRAQYV